MSKHKMPSYMYFEGSSYPWKKHINYRVHSELYKVGKGEQGVLICEPYKTEIGKFWRFKTPLIAKVSSRKIYSLFKNYLKNNDFVGADMARKYLQMGFTRARRYANYKGGVKYDKTKNYTLLKKGTGDPLKNEAASIFYVAWKKAEAVTAYKKMKKEWIKKYG